MLPERRVRLSLEQLEDRCVPATITVTNLNDGTGVPGMTLREAVEKANENVATDTIVFKTGLKGTIALTSNLGIHTSLKINGPGASKITLQGSVGNRVFEINDGSASLINVRISKLSLTGGDDTSGGAIQCEENLTVANARFFDNQSEVGGGAIFHTTGNLTLLNTTIHGNRSTSGVAAGVLFDSPGTLTVTNCSFFDNRASTGGAALKIQNAASATISKSRFTENRAGGGGGAINWIGPGSFTMSECSLIGNATTAGGGALFIDGGATEILKSTIAYNSAGASGGGIQVSNGADLLMRNSTVSSNRTAINGGGFSIASGDVTVLNSTVAYNQADGNGGGFHSAAPTVFVISTIVARNTALNNGNDLSSVSNPGNQFSLFNSLLEDDNATFADLDIDSSCVLGVNPLLGPLQNNGGPTLTHALLAGSPALDLGTDTLGNSTTDQRGAGFKRIKGAGIDIGAFER